MTDHLVDVLIPTCSRPAALAVTLTCLATHEFRDFRVIVSDQTEHADVADSMEVQAAARVLDLHGSPVTFLKNLPRRGMAQQRQFLLDQATAPYALFVDDDLILEPWLIGMMVGALREENQNGGSAGFCGCAVIGLSYLNDVRPAEQDVELWAGPVQPEVVRPGTPAWERWPLHNAANTFHVQQSLGATPDRPIKYKVAWVGGCALFDTAKLRDCGGYDFWDRLVADHAGEDVLAQQRVMARYGGFGVMPSGVYHQELPTNVPVRTEDAPKVLDLNGLRVAPQP
ncbi:MAG TPA: glycosyltransferase family A protein [Anaerolineae bacterium]|nr:glycosyltransferase family A protein [Anaerolineae bacterium]